MKPRVVVPAVFFFLFLQLGLARAEGKADDAKAMVKKAIEYIQANGQEKALEQFNNQSGEFIKGELYIFVIRASDCVTLANGGNPKLVGKALCDLKDADGKYFQKQFIEVAQKGGGWVDYKWTNPETKKIGDKTAYVEKTGDLVVGCGFYK